MENDVDEELMAETADNRRMRLAKTSCCRRHGLPVSLVMITIVSCVMSLFTLVVYLNKDDNYHEHDNHSPQLAASRDVSNHSLYQEIPVFAHKILLAPSKDSGDSDSQESPRNHQFLINPDDNLSVYEISQGVTLLRTGIQILHSGTYFAYKSIYFKHFSRMECEKLASKNVESFLTQNSTLNEGGITTLIRSHHTCCPSCRDVSETAFAGGVFYFQERDIIQVSVAEDDWVDVERDITYIGLMKLGTLH